MRFFKRRAQSLIEYVTLISIVTMALTILFPLVKRAVQSVVKTGADLVGNQPNTQIASSKYMSNSRTNTSVVDRKTTTQTPGQVQITDRSTVSSNTITATNM